MGGPSVRSQFPLTLLLSKYMQNPSLMQLAWIDSPLELRPHNTQEKKLNWISSVVLVVVVVWLRLRVPRCLIGEFIGFFALFLSFLREWRVSSDFVVCWIHVHMMDRPNFFLTWPLNCSPPVWLVLLRVSFYLLALVYPPFFFYLS